MNKYKISVCIPVYNTEKVLERCLNSLTFQDFSSFEIVIVNDCSPGKNEKNWNCRKIVKKFSKSCKIPINYSENSENRGIFETRRTLFYEAQGDFIFYLDSDDYLEKNSLSLLYQAAVENNAQIIQGKLISGKIINNQFQLDKKQKLTNTYNGLLNKHDIFTKTFVEKNISTNLCGKLILKDLLKKAFDTIPYTYCFLAEDFLIFFFTTLNADVYLGTDILTYYYDTQNGITSFKTVPDIQECAKAFSAASIFAILSEWITENPDVLTQNEIDALKIYSLSFLKNNIDLIEKRVLPELKPEAYKLLNEFWGKNLVNITKKNLYENE